MTRKENKKKYLIAGRINNDIINDVIDHIYGDFESRTCKNCSHGTEEDGDVYECHISRDLFGWDNVVTLKDFGCNKFERKTDGNV